MPRPAQSEVLGERPLERQLCRSEVLCPADIVHQRLKILQTGQLHRIGYEKTEEVEVSRLFHIYDAVIY